MPTSVRAEETASRAVGIKRPAPKTSVPVEEISEPRFPFFGFLSVSLVEFMPVVRTWSGAIVVKLIEARTTGTLDQLIEFTPVEPNTSAGRAVINLDPLTIGHPEFNLTSRAQHRMLLKNAWLSPGVFLSADAIFKTANSGYPVSVFSMGRNPASPAVIVAATSRRAPLSRFGQKNAPGVRSM
jgi:hypothetical protein